MNVALSTWTLDPLLASRYPDTPADPRQGRASHSGTLEIFDVPQAAKDHGIDRLEVPHFHLPSDEAEQERFAANAREAGVVLQTLLIDDGDLSHPEHSARDEAWVSGWITAAARLGFARVRIIAGKQERTPETFARSLEAMARLADQAQRLGVRASTENWHLLLATPEAVLSYLGRLDRKVGLCVDFGNWAPEIEEAGLPLILPLAETVHAKVEISSAGELDEDRFRRQAREAGGVGFTGPYVLVADGPGDRWQHIVRLRELLNEF